MARPSRGFDSSRYFRGPGDLGFYNVGTAAMRELVGAIHARHKDEWSIDEAMAFAEALIVDRHLEAKSVGIELVARYRRAFTPSLLPAWKRWFAGNHSATTFEWTLLMLSGGRCKRRFAQPTFLGPGGLN